MKKIVVLFTLVALMVLSLSCSALGAGQAYFDYIANGEYVEGDLSGFNLGLDYKVDSFKFGVDYLVNGEIEDILDYEQMYVKVGFKATDNIFITLSMFDNNNEFSIYSYYLKESANGLLLGADISYDFSDQFTFEGSLGISIKGECEYSYSLPDGSDSGNPDADLTLLKLKLIYNVSKNMGISLGYNDISIDPQRSASYDINYMTLGATYKF